MISRGENDGMIEKPNAPAVARNRDAILEVLLAEFADRRHVLEIGSGTGEHAVFFAPHLHWLTWQTSDRAMNHPGILAWLAESSAPNVKAPLVIDVGSAPDLPADFDGVFSANTAHIMSEAEVRQMFALVGSVLLPGGRFCLYGPFNVGGEFTSDSNARFDASLRGQNPLMGIRDLELLDELANTAGMLRNSLHAMPANNFIAAWSAAAG
jgi:SAM-dependent methyltransferase